MPFTLTDDPQFYGLMSCNNIFMIGLFRSNNRMVISSKTGKKIMSQQTHKGPYIYGVHLEGRWGASKICHMSADSQLFLPTHPSPYSTDDQTKACVTFSWR